MLEVKVFAIAFNEVHDLLISLTFILVKEFNRFEMTICLLRSFILVDNMLFRLSSVLF